MRIRPLLVVVVAGALLPAYAANAESCGLVEDAANDTRYADRDETSGVLPNEMVDIVSADVAADAQTLYAVVRVAGLEPSWAPGQNVSRTYRLEFTANGRKLFVSATDASGVTLGGPTTMWGIEFRAGTIGLRSRTASGAFDMEGDEIRVQAPLTHFAGAKLKPGDRISGLAVSAVGQYTNYGQIAPGVSGNVAVTDAAAGTAAYTIGDESCVELLKDTDAYHWGH